MKTAGALTIIFGIIAGIFLLLLPAKVSILGTSASCAPPVIQLVAEDASASEDSITASVMHDCKNQSGVRCLLGVIVFAVSLGGGGIMLVVGGSRHSQPQLFWDGYRWINRV